MSVPEDDFLFRRRLTRRNLLRAGAGATGAALLSGLLAACGTSERGGTGGGQTGGGQGSGQSGSAGDVLFLSTQFKPVEEAEKMRKQILAGFNGKVEYLPEDDAPFTDRIRSEAQAGKTSASLVGALHGGIEPFVKGDLLEDLSPLVNRLRDRGFPQAFLDLSRFGRADRYYYVPWVQATYIMAANKKALQHLPQGANVDALTFAQLKEWGANLQRATGQRRLGFPAGPKGLLPRFFQGYLYPSFTRSSGVVEFKSAEAAGMWNEFKEIWASTNPQSTNYENMQEPLLSDEAWVAWDHVARLIGAVRDRPNDFVMFPAPAGPKGRGFMPVLAGLAIPKGAPNRAGAEQLIEYLTMPQQQIATARELAFFPATGTAIPEDLPAGIKLEAEAVKKQTSAGDAVATLLPVGLGAKGGEFNKVYFDTFTRIVLRNEPVQGVLDEQARVLQGIINETGAACWAPDPASNGPCQVK
ncbi:MAG: extracellular solute-binding protein [Chloroflexota bacterium]|nr:extracellular solute-binding protein [Chloroflexota bacterium]